MLSAVLEAPEEADKTGLGMLADAEDDGEDDEPDDLPASDSDEVSGVKPNAV